MQVLLSKIAPDAQQPRKFFAADAMFTLKESIRQHGIVSPLVVHDQGDGTFLLVDGERRFRAAKELKLKEVPVIIRKKTNATDLLIEQFNIQEQHEAWTPMEKAQALIKLSEALGLTLPEVCRQLGLSKSETSRYTAFAQLANKSAYVSSEIPLDYALEIIQIKRIAKKVTEEHLRKEFDLDDEKRLEGRIIKAIRDGAIVSRTDASRLKDSFTKNPKTIEKYLKDDHLTPTALYLETGAQGARALRNAVFNANYIANHGSMFLRTRDVKVSPEQLGAFKRAAEVLAKIIDLVE